MSHTPDSTLASESDPAHRAFADGVPGFSYPDLYSPARLRDLYLAWEGRLRASDPALCARYVEYRDDRQGGALGPAEVSALLVEVAPHVGRFLAELFRVTRETDAEHRRTAEDLVVFRFKDEFVKRRASKRKVADSDVAAARQGRRAARVPRPCCIAAWRRARGGSPPGLRAVH